MAGLKVPPGGGFWERGQEHSRTGIQAYGQQTKRRETKIDPPDKTAGGGLMSGAGGAAAGYSIATAVGAANPAIGLGIGAGVGLISYLMS